MLSATASDANAWATGGLFVLAFAGAFIGGVSWLIRRGKRDQKLDELIRKVTPNGGDTEELGDVAKRTEEKVDGIVTRFDRHLGHSDAVEREVFRRLDKLEGASGGARRPPSSRRRGS